MTSARRVARSQPAIEHEQRRRARAASSLRRTRGARHRRLAGGHARGTPVRALPGAGAPRPAPRVPGGAPCSRADSSWRRRCSACRSGRCHPGRAADLVVCDYVPPTPLTAGNLAAHLIAGVQPSMISRRHGGRPVGLPGRRPGEHRRRRGVLPGAAAGRGALEAHAWLNSCPCRCGLLLRRAYHEFRRRRAIFDLPERKFRRAPNSAGPALDLSVRVRRHACRQSHRAGGRAAHAARAEHRPGVAGRRAHLRAQDRPGQRPADAVAPVHRHGHRRLQHRVVAGIAARGVAARVRQGVDAHRDPGAAACSNGSGLGIRDSGLAVQRTTVRLRHQCRVRPRRHPQPAVVHWLESMRDASAIVDEPAPRDPGRVLASSGTYPFRTAWPAGITLSTFHGTPAAEIERIGEFLIGELGFHTVIKLNPPMLGRDRVEHILHGVLGYADVAVNPEVYDRELPFDDAVGIVRRLQALAARRGLTVGVKCGNTLEVLNTGTFLKERVQYLSGQPLHALHAALAHCAGARRSAPACRSRSPPAWTRTTSPTASRPASSRSRPARTCSARAGTAGSRATSSTSRPGCTPPARGRSRSSSSGRRGWRPPAGRTMTRRAGRCSSTRGRSSTAPWPASGTGRPRTGSRPGSSARVSGCGTACPAPSASRRARTTRSSRSRSSRSSASVPVIEVEGGGWREVDRRLYRALKPTQIAIFADACNECGNCDVFCPEDGGP